ncbi:MAG: alkaline phosphatase family protein [Flammeovirgaceae bacterium]|nr:MAG: alkaline phosphatase family protein [Flammeovirgaceae bacterium]
MSRIAGLFTLILIAAHGLVYAQQKAVFIILDGISADVLEKVETPSIDAIAKAGGYTRACTGGLNDSYNQSPTISAPGYNHVLTGVWSNKHNVWDNSIKEPNYHYWNIFRIAKHAKPGLKTAIFSTWQDNRTKLIGEGLETAGNFKFDYAFDGFEVNEKQFPHDADKKYIFDIDEHVSKEAARYIRERAPDVSWVYLEYTDDIGHRHGDSPDYERAIQFADEQVGRIWEAVQFRQKQVGEDWMIVVTTDHGRDPQTGKGHGGQSDRERTVWIATNAKNLNGRFGQGTAAVDIMPSLLWHLKINPPEEIIMEQDGVPFIGPVSVADAGATLIDDGKKIELRWTVLEGNSKPVVYLSTTNNFKTGGKDEWQRIKCQSATPGRCTIDVSRYPSSFYKIVVKGRSNSINTQVVKNH